MSLIGQLINNNSIYNFNLVERDKWVINQAKLLPPGTKILDVGAGSAPYRKYFSHCDYKTQDFTQLSPEQLREHKGYGQIDYVSDILNIPVADGSVDAVLCTEVFEHVPEPIKAIHEISRLIKCGGKLIFSAPLGSGLHQEPYHFYGGYTPFWYNKFLTEAGFEQIAIEPNGGFFKHFGQECMRFCRMTAPFKFIKNPLLAILWFPVWLCLSVKLGLIMPLLCHLFDSLDTYKGFTIGYHVTAVKK